MNPQQPLPPALISGRRRPRRAARARSRSLGAYLAAGGAPAMAYPGYSELEDESRTRAFLTGSALLHAAALAALVVVASLTPVIEEQIIPVQLFEEPQPAPEPADPEPAPAPKALAQRRNLPFAPSVQAVEPQIVNPSIVAEARPAVVAEALEMDAVGTAAAPTQVDQRALVVEHVSPVSTAVRARVATVDVARLASPAVRGPTRVEGPVGPSVGPKRVEAAAAGTTVGTAPLAIGGGSSVREGVISDRDVVGVPDGAVQVSIDTSLGRSELAGTSPSGTGGHPAPQTACTQRPEVAAYMASVESRMYERWLLPPGIAGGQTVKLRFQLDAAGSASRISIVEADDNALGASAVDALRSAAPFPPMPETVRCLSQLSIVGTFTNPVGG